MYYNPILFAPIRALVGPLAGIALGECLYGLLLVSSTTGWFYWTLIGAAGVTLLATTLVRRAGRRGPAIVGVAVALTIAGGFFVASSALGSAATNF